MDDQLDKEDLREPDPASILAEDGLLGDDLGVDLGDDLDEEDDAPIEDSFDDEEY